MGIVKEGEGIVEEYKGSPALDASGSGPSICTLALGLL
jgi:hypothetical protein